MTKHVVDRKIYDTETATLIHKYCNGCSISDFDYLAEDLYQTLKGNFFILGNGGEFTKYGTNNGGVGLADRSDVITPVSKEFALEWLEKHGGSEKAIELAPGKYEEA